MIAYADIPSGRSMAFSIDEEGEHKKRRRRNTKSAKLSAHFFALFIGSYSFLNRRPIAPAIRSQFSVSRERPLEDFRFSHVWIVFFGHAREDMLLHLEYP
jgi:hypothetical protein